jgi:hypothetical protein
VLQRLRRSCHGSVAMLTVGRARARRQE